MAAGDQLSEIEELRRQIGVARTEIKNIRQNMFAMKKKQEQDIKEIRKLLQGDLPGVHRDTATKSAGHVTLGEPTPGTSHGSCTETKSRTTPDCCDGRFTFRPIAYAHSVFTNKNGTPRQSGLVGGARAHFTIGKDVFTNPQHALEGLKEFSHVWLLFVFHDNGGEGYRAKVRPPRLDGVRTGVFSTRSPHRPNPV